MTIGPKPAGPLFEPETFSGNASDTIFTLARAPGGAKAVLVSVAGALLRPTTDYTVSGVTLTFTSAPASGTNNILVQYLGSSVLMPTDGGVDAESVEAAGAVMEADYDANSILKADTADTPTALTVAEQRIVGRITSGNITGLTAAEVRTLINVEDDAQSNTLSSEGTGESLVGTKTDSALGIKSPKAGTNVTITDDGAGSLVFAATGGGGYSNGVKVLTSADHPYSVVVGDKASLLVVNSAGAFTINLPTTGWNAEEYVDVLNIGEGLVTVDAQGEGLNRAGVDTRVISQDEWVPFMLRQLTDPRWLTDIIETVSLGANQYLRGDASGDPQAADDLRTIAGSIVATSAMTVVVLPKAPYPMTLSDAFALTNASGTASWAVRVAGVAATGFDTPVAVDDSGETTSSGHSVEEGDQMEIAISSPAGLTAFAFQLNLVRTGNPA